LPSYDSQIELSIILVNWNGGTLLCRAVNSIVAFPPSVEYEVIVIDNASQDESITILRSSDAAKLLNSSGRLRIIENVENRGFGRANNQAFELTNAPLLFLLNPDAEITAGSIDQLIQTVRSNPRIGAAGPRILNPDGSLQISVWRNPPAAWEIVLSSLKLYLLLPRKFRGELLLGGHWDHNSERPVPMLGGAAVLVRGEVIKTVGGFDERFHMYGEDHEWSLRMTRAGWLLMFQPEATAIHQGAWSSLQRWTNLEKIRVQLEAHYSFQKHALSRGRLITNLIAYCFTESAQHVWRRLRGVDAPEVKLISELYWEHLKRALRNNHRS
jgi:GT2 family glycosyltransferase